MIPKMMPHVTKKKKDVGEKKYPTQNSLECNAFF